MTADSVPGVNHGVAPDVNVRPAPPVNPVAALGAGLLVTLTVLLSVDLVSAGILLACELALVPVVGVGVRMFVRRTWFLPLLALSAGWGTALLAEKTGEVVFALGPVVLTTDSLLAGAAIAVRALALAVPAVLLALTTDPTDLADGLVQKVRLPERFVLAALAAGRLVTLLVEEWRVLRMARRARGLGARSAAGEVLDGVTSFFPLAFALLVQAVRRGTRLAMAMEGRAFGTTGRTWSRDSVFTRRDGVLVGVTLVVCAVAVTAAVLTGAWNSIL